MKVQELEEKRSDSFEKIEANLTTATSELNTIIAELEELKTFSDSLMEKYQDMPETEQRAFGDAINRVILEIEDIEAPKDLLEYQQKIHQAYEDPIIESIQGDLLDVLDHLSILISEEERIRLLRTIEASISSNPQDSKETVSELTTRLDTLPDPILRSFATEIESDHTVLSNPSRLLDYLKKLEKRNQLLRSLNDKFSTADWIPSEVEEIDEWVVLYDLDKNIGELETIFEGIDEGVGLMSSKLPIEVTMQTYLENELEEFKNAPESVFQVCSTHIDSILAQRKELQEIEDLSEVADPEEDDIDFLQEYVTLSSEPPEGLSELTDSIHGIVTEYNDWKRDVQVDWGNLQPILKTYIDRLELSPPDIVDEFIDAPLPFDDQVSTAYSVLIAAEDWIDSKEEDMLEQVSDEARTIFRNLAEDGEHELSKEDLDALEEVMDIVDVKVVIDE